MVSRNPLLVNGEWDVVARVSRDSCVVVLKPHDVVLAKKIAKPNLHKYERLL